jgi:hypothetical protein
LTLARISATTSPSASRLAGHPGGYDFCAGNSKQNDAGKIGYQTFSADSLDIVGAGTAGSNRKVKIWAEGGTVFNGTVSATTFSGGAGDMALPAANLYGSVPSVLLTAVPAANLTGSVPSAALTSVPAASLTGTIPDARLSTNVLLATGTNVALRAGGNRFTGPQLVGDSVPGPETLDQQPPTAVAFQDQNPLFLWQSFSAGQTGLLTRIGFYITSPESPQGAGATLSIYAGEGTGGALLDTETIVIQPNWGYQLFQLSTPPAIQAGSKYTIALSVGAANLFWIRADIGNPYAGGRSDFSATADYSFQTYATPVTNRSILSVNQAGDARVGVGTAAPQATLHVVGDILASGTITGTLNSSNLAGPVSFVNLPAGVISNNASGVQLSGTFAGNGSGLTGLTASNLTGTIADARLSANVALLNSANVFSGSNRFTAALVATNGSNQFAGAFTGTNLFSAAVGIAAANPGQILQLGDDTTGTAQGMIRLGSRSASGSSHRSWDIGVPQTGDVTTNMGYSFIIRDNNGGNTNSHFIVRWDTHSVGIGINNPQATLDVAGSLRINQGTTFTRVQDGIFTAGPSTVNLLTVTNSFPVAFGAAPNVTATAVSQAGTDFNDTFCVTVRRVTTTNFVVNIVRVDTNGNWGQNLSVSYHAWQ